MEIKDPEEMIRVATEKIAKALMDPEKEPKNSAMESLEQYNARVKNQIFQGVNGQRQRLERGYVLLMEEVDA